MPTIACAGTNAPVERNRLTRPVSPAAESLTDKSNGGIVAAGTSSAPFPLTEPVSGTSAEHAERTINNIKKRSIRYFRIIFPLNTPFGGAFLRTSINRHIWVYPVLKRKIPIYWITRLGYQDRSHSFFTFRGPFWWLAPGRPANLPILHKYSERGMV